MSTIRFPKLFFIKIMSLNSIFKLKKINKEFNFIVETYLGFDTRIIKNNILNK